MYLSVYSLYIFIVFRFLEECQTDPNNTSDNKLRTYETELGILQDMIQQSTTALLTESDNIVKITLVKKAITRLCVLFGKQKGRCPFSSDISLYHTPNAGYLL